MATWAILTGEYPPTVGGVSAYTQLLANALARAGDLVSIWAPPAPHAHVADSGVTVHPLPDHFGPRSLPVLDRAFLRLPPQARILVQYVPHAFGWKAMNLPFCLWLSGRWRNRFEVMFHEVCVVRVPGQPWKLKLLAHATRRMAGLLHRAAKRSWVATPAWEKLLRAIAPRAADITWLPVPSNLPVNPNAAQVVAIRRRIASDDDTQVVAHFGTYRADDTPLLSSVLPRILSADPRRRALLVGRHSHEFRQQLVQEHPALAPRTLSTGALAPDELVNTLSAADLLLQPYPDGVSTRRGSAMAGLALGLPVVTTEGPSSEPLWRESRAVALTPAGDENALIHSVELLLPQPAVRAQLGESARCLYARHFGLDRVVQTLRSC